MIRFNKAFVLTMVASFAMGCSNSNDVADAQLCLDKIDDTQAQSTVDSAVNSCLSKISSESTTEANAVKCSGNLMLGGITSGKVFQAFKATTNKESASSAQLMLVISVTKSSNATENKSLAKNTYDLCQASGVSGLKWIAGLSYMGTSLVNGVAASICPGGDVTACDFTNNSTASSVMSTCSSSPSSCDPQAVGETAVLLNEAYCTGDNAKTETCQKFAAAVNSGGSTSDIGASIITQFQPTP